MRSNAQATVKIERIFLQRGLNDSVGNVETTSFLIHSILKVLRDIQVFLQGSEGTNLMILLPFSIPIIKLASDSEA